MEEHYIKVSCVSERIPFFPNNTDESGEKSQNVLIRFEVIYKEKGRYLEISYKKNERLFFLSFFDRRNNQATAIDLIENIILREKIN